MSTYKVANIVIIDENPEARLLIRESVQGYSDLHVLAETDSLIYGYELIRQNRPELVFIDLRDNIQQSLDLVSRISSYFRDTLIFVSGESLTLEGVIACMQAGAREFLTRPLNPEEIATYIDKHKEELTLDRSQGDQNGRLITVFSNKGGLGKTTVAVNLAVAISEVLRKPVAVVDLNLQLGDVTTFLDLQPKQTIVDIARNLGRVDAAYLENSLATYETDKAKLYVLADPMQVEDAEEVTAAQINTVLTVLKSTFEYVIVDTTTSFDAKTLTALDLADNILLTSIINLPCIRSTQRVLTLFDRLGYDKQKIKLLINRFVPGDEITVDDVEETLEHEVFWKLPNNYVTVMNSINRGMPIAVLDDESPIWSQFLELAHRLSGVIRSKEEAVEAILENKTQKKSLLSALFQKK